MAGYSKKTLVQKLGIKPGKSIFIKNDPPGYEISLGILPSNVRILDSLEPNIDFIQVFVTSIKELEENVRYLKPFLAKTGMFWVSWPKLSSKMKTNLNENIVQKAGLAKGLVDVKVCAIDQVWSGLKFVYRLKDR